MSNSKRCLLRFCSAPWKTIFSVRRFTGHREHQADERTEANLVRRRNDEVKRNGPFVIHQILNREIARRSILRHSGSL